MSGPQSLKQLIAVNAAELVVVNDKLSVLTAGDGDLTALIDANAVLIAANKSSLDALTISANGTASALESVTGVEKARAEGAEAALGVRIDDASTALVASEARSAALVVVERQRAQAIEGPLRTDVNAAILSAGKRTFVHTMEFDGAPVVGEYPFCCGAGVPSSAGFGVTIPVSYLIVAYAFTCDAVGDVPPTRLELELYNIAREKQIGYELSAMNTTTKYAGGQLPFFAGGPGSVCAKIKQVDSGNTGIPVDPQARYRLSIYFQSAFEF